jgi:hypothetical protein
MPRRIITATLIVTIGLAALSGSAMASRLGPIGVGNTSHSAGPAYSPQDKQVIPPAPVTAQPAPRVSTPTGGGFSALDTALVSAGGLALLLVLAGGTAVLLRRRGGGLRHPAALTH